MVKPPITSTGLWGRSGGRIGGARTLRGYSTSPPLTLSSSPYPPSPLVELSKKYPSAWSLPDLVAYPHSPSRPPADRRLRPPKHQLYLSTSTNPFLNLAIEHYLFTHHHHEQHSVQTQSPDRKKDLQDTAAGGTPKKTLFFYINSPCVVIGRNQNPWREANIPALTTNSHYTNLPRDPELVRRKSGGGTVYHDLGNVNYSAIVGSRFFERDAHAKMVVRALRNLGVPGATVNERHDVVVEAPEGTNKISGSAYKISRHASYHHGTMLLDSALGNVQGLLRSNAAEWIVGRGVESVRSPVCNVQVGVEDFVTGVAREWARAYKICHRGEQDDLWKRGLEYRSEGDPDIAICWVGEAEKVVPEVGAIMNELLAPEWIYGQTPKFTFSIPIPLDLLKHIKNLQPFLAHITSKTEEADDKPQPTALRITIDKGVILSAEYDANNLGIEPNLFEQYIPAGLVGGRFDGRLLRECLEKSEVFRHGNLQDWRDSVTRRVIGEVESWGDWRAGGGALESLKS